MTLRFVRLSGFLFFPRSRPAHWKDTRSRMRSPSARRRLQRAHVSAATACGHRTESRSPARPVGQTPVSTTGEPCSVREAPSLPLPVRSAGPLQRTHAPDLVTDPLFGASPGRRLFPGPQAHTGTGEWCRSSSSSSSSSSLPPPFPPHAGSPTPPPGPGPSGSPPPAEKARGHMVPGRRGREPVAVRWDAGRRDA